MPVTYWSVSDASLHETNGAPKAPQSSAKRCRLGPLRDHFWEFPCNFTHFLRSPGSAGSTGQLRRAFLTHCRARKRTESLNIYTWTSKCLLDDPLDPWITKMVSQVPKMEPPGLKNESFLSQKLPIFTVSQPAVPCIQGGRRQGRSLQIFAPTL